MVAAMIAIDMTAAGSGGEPGRIAAECLSWVGACAVVGCRNKFTISTRHAIGYEP
jgi:hypothetical protein